MGANSLRYRSQSVVDAGDKEIKDSELIKELAKQQKKTREVRKAQISGIEEEAES